MVTKSFDIIFRNKGLKELTKGTSQANKNISDMQKNVGNLGQKLTKFFGAGSNFGKPFEAMTANMQIAQNMGMSFFASLQAGVISFGTSATAVFGGLLPMVGALAAALAPFALIVVGIIAGIFLLKKAWDNNLGGIQTRFSQVMGMLKDAWGKFSVGVNKFMQQISPIMKPFVDILFFLAKVSIKRLIFSFKLLGFAIKIALIPFKVLAFWIKLVFNAGKKLFSLFLKLPFVQKVVKGIARAFEVVKFTVQKIWQFIKPIIDGILALARVLGLINEKSNTVNRAQQGGRFQNVPLIGGSGGGNNSTKNVTNSPTINIQSGGAIKQQDAPRIADIISNSLISGARGG